MDDGVILWLIGFAYMALEGLGILTAIHAVMTVRTSQGAIAWAVSLITFPPISLPLYFVFGRNRFEGYVQARRRQHPRFREMMETLRDSATAGDIVVAHENPTLAVFEALGEMPLTRGNSVKLLIDGEATFDGIFAAVDMAERYVVVQFYIVRDDTLGRELKSRIIAKASAGVTVYFLYDEIGSQGLPKAFLNDLIAAGVKISAFHSRKGRRNRFQLNFRNHRKIVVADGSIAFVGGHNVGDEYLGRSVRFGSWRDTHLRVVGPAVAEMQLVFAEDWHWATGEVPELDWTPKPSGLGDKSVLVLPSGPADELETCGLFFTEAINSAKHRLWIASPYFVPDSRIMGALFLASLRGVDVRIVLPERSDHYLVYLASFAFIPESVKMGVKFFRYQTGFLHHKVMLVDDRTASIGTANLDNRSFRLNFELSAVIDDEMFARDVRTMFERDFANCRQALADDYATKPIWFKVAVRVANLMSPIL